MTATEFHETMLRLLRREPFQPFEIELADGRVLPVDDPERVATNGGAASWGRESGDIVLFEYENTVRIGGARAPA